jgi:hypothetical protein
MLPRECYATKHSLPHIFMYGPFWVFFCSPLPFCFVSCLMSRMKKSKPKAQHGNLLGSQDSKISNARMCVWVGVMVASCSCSPGSATSD